MEERTGGKVSSFPGVPEYTYISDLLADRFDENVVYATFDNRKRDDFKPYVLKSADHGNSWISIASNLPDSGTVHTIGAGSRSARTFVCGNRVWFLFQH